MAKLIDWMPIKQQLAGIASAAKGEPAWPPVALFKAMLLTVWYDLSDVKLAEALDGRSSFRRFCGFSALERTPERTAFVRFRTALAARGLDKALFEAITAQLRAKAIRVKTGTLVDATISASASEQDGDAHWVKHKGKPADHGFTAHVGADADTALVEEIAINPAKSLPTVPIAAAFAAMRCEQMAGGPASLPPACGDATKPKPSNALMPGTSRSTACGGGSRKSSAYGSAAMAYAG